MTPDLIVFNANIRTMDMARPRAEALVVGGGRILALGSDADMRALAGPGTRMIDAGGRLVLPGFQDAHNHLLDSGTDMIASAALDEVTTLSGMQAALADFAAGSDLPVVMGSGWSTVHFGDQNLTRAVLDRAVPDRPCIVVEASAHNACANSSALRMAGVDRGTPDPLNGHFVLDAAGEPTGMLHEDAINWVQSRLPQITDDLWIAGLRAGMAHANRHGITGIIDPKVIDYHARAYQAVSDADGLSLRVCGAALVSPSDTATGAVERLSALRRDHGGPDFRVQSAKFFFDGVFENRTAALIAPYADAAGGNAALMFQPGKIAELFTALDAARFQIHVHVIGDMAARAALDGLDAAMAANGRWPSLHQLAHLQLMHADDIPRLGALGVMANIQPLWATGDPEGPGPVLAMIGAARMPLTYAFRRMLTEGAPFCLSSDFAVTTLNPFEIMETAITRQPPGRAGQEAPFLPAEGLTVEECVLGYTAHAAAACWRGDMTGRITPGFSADLIVLDRDILNCPSDRISATQVLLTLFKGREVWRDPRLDG
jgi:predicted amidohydrolase YtcJ